MPDPYPNYLSGWVKCHCGAQSPTTKDPMDPFRWQAKHTCEKENNQ